MEHSILYYNWEVPWEKNKCNTQKRALMSETTKRRNTTRTNSSSSGYQLSFLFSLLGRKNQRKWLLSVFFRFLCSFECPWVSIEHWNSFRILLIHKKSEKKRNYFYILCYIFFGWDLHSFLPLISQQPVLLSCKSAGLHTLFLSKDYIISSWSRRSPWLSISSFQVILILYCIWSCSLKWAIVALYNMRWSSPMLIPEAIRQIIFPNNL